MRFLLGLLFAIFLKRTASRGNVYDFKTCGLPGPSYLDCGEAENGITDESQNCEYDRVDSGKSYDYEYYVLSDEAEPFEQDDNDPMRRKVMGGVRASPGELPWAVYIERIDGNIVYHCGGTLISKRHVLTAAHCFKRYKTPKACSIARAMPVKEALKNVKVLVGGICSEVNEKYHCTKADTGEWFGIKRAEYRPYFEADCFGTRDIAILELEMNVPDHIHHICLPHLHKNVDIDDPTLRMSSFGWGADPKINLKRTPFLQKVDLGVRMTKEQCAKARSNLVKEDMFCTYELPDVNVCHGDSGGGIIASINGRKFIAGIVSYGSSCFALQNGSTPKAQVNTNVKYYTSLIDTFLRRSRREINWHEKKLDDDGKKETPNPWKKIFSGLF